MVKVNVWNAKPDLIHKFGFIFYFCAFAYVWCKFVVQGGRLDINRIKIYEDGRFKYELIVSNMPRDPAIAV